MHRKTHIIIGTSAAGLSAARTLARLDKESHIICLSQELEQPYNKCFLADYLSGEITWEKVQTTTVNGTRTKGIVIKLGETVTHIDSKNKKISLDSGEQLAYDTLFIGAGSSPFIPAINGLSSIEKKYTFHTAQDAKELLAYATENPGCRAVVIGAGLSGLECADSLTSQGAHVTVLERSDHILTRQTDQKGAQFIAQQMVNQGIGLHCNTFIDHVEQEDNYINIVLSSGKRIQAEILVIAAGVRPNGAIAATAGAGMLWGGIVVDEYMKSSLPDTYAGGDVAVVKDVLSGEQVLSCSWPDACLQGAMAARSMAGHPKSYPGVSLITSTSFFGLKFASCGSIAAPPVDCTVIERSLGGGYQKLLLKDQKLVGFITIGHKTYLTVLKRAILTGQIVDLDSLLGEF